MKNKILTVILAVLLLMLFGCDDKEAVEASVDITPTASTSAPDVTVPLSTAQPDKAGKAIINICPCYEAYHIEDFAAVKQRYEQLFEEAEQTGNFPVIVLPDDELVRNIYSNLDLLEYQDTGFENVPQSLIKMGIDDIREHSEGAEYKTLLSQLRVDREMNFGVVDFEASSSPVSEDITDDITLPDTSLCSVALILLFPTDTPWDILSALPPGGWNECPSAYAFSEMAKHWFDDYGAVPALISSRCVQFKATRELSLKSAEDLAVEQYCLAPQSEMFKGAGARGVAKYIKDADYWRFDWIRTR